MIPANPIQHLVQHACTCQQRPPLMSKSRQPEPPGQKGPTNGRDQPPRLLSRGSASQQYTVPSQPPITLSDVKLPHSLYHHHPTGSLAINPGLAQEGPTFATTPATTSLEGRIKYPLPPKPSFLAAPLQHKSTRPPGPPSTSSHGPSHVKPHRGLSESNNVPLGGSSSGQGYGYQHSQWHVRQSSVLDDHQPHHIEAYHSQVSHVAAYTNNPPPSSGLVGAATGASPPPSDKSGWRRGLSFPQEQAFHDLQHATQVPASPFNQPPTPPFPPPILPLPSKTTNRISTPLTPPTAPAAPAAPSSPPPTPPLPPTPPPPAYAALPELGVNTVQKAPIGVSKGIDTVPGQDQGGHQLGREDVVAQGRPQKQVTLREQPSSSKNIGTQELGAEQSNPLSVWPTEGRKVQSDAGCAPLVRHTLKSQPFAPSNTHLAKRPKILHNPDVLASANLPDSKEHIVAKAKSTGPILATKRTSGHSVVDKNRGSLRAVPEQHSDGSSNINLSLATTHYVPSTSHSSTPSTVPDVSAKQTGIQLSKKMAVSVSQKHPAPITYDSVVAYLSSDSDSGSESESSIPLALLHTGKRKAHTGFDACNKAGPRSIKQQMTFKKPKLVIDISTGVSSAGGVDAPHRPTPVEGLLYGVDFETPGPLPPKQAQQYPVTRRFPQPARGPPTLEPSRVEPGVPPSLLHGYLSLSGPTQEEEAKDTSVQKSAPEPLFMPHSPSPEPSLSPGPSTSHVAQKHVASQMLFDSISSSSTGAPSIVEVQDSSSSSETMSSTAETAKAAPIIKLPSRLSRDSKFWRRAKVVLPLDPAKRQMLIQKGLYDVSSDDINPQELINQEQRPKDIRIGQQTTPTNPISSRIKSIIVLGGSKTVRVRSPSPIPQRFTAANGPQAATYSNVLCETLLDCCTVNECKWNHCAAILASENLLRLHFHKCHLNDGPEDDNHWKVQVGVNKWHFKRFKRDKSNYIEPVTVEFLFQCLWRTCDKETFSTHEKLLQHVIGKHISNTLTCPYDCWSN
ncbi:hypothetical protein, variant 2 [Cryptococcus amylolentus CBS 6039]|uniref:C2H2-type domain-containing protein n=2 Tax=Cryptococcus amylolentus CBS 6039 TaxID=1295533 RepID=A0A1E3HGF6_9TREE|nr:hypothetical protein, variant 1 [Cryptococcus amylolentus CBS 6039]XP_018991089.1 hypothetical protein, variant 2 [Cryptococcus amylolentus CBS 6039]ODN75438.1 hypothetical protein, variant 1 [Cryptococcus amylolentus CBS 6039]ODN75439.1 hypothetical protein, variant 2 [Cryptococcus amylolentus CBS 6039]